MTEPTILFENSEIVVIDKPAGMLVHPAEGGELEGTLALWHVRRRPEAAAAHADPLRPGIVHRLDRDTSGVMVLAITAAAHKKLSDQFRARTAEKTYRALVQGIMKEDRGVIDRALAADPAQKRRVTAPLGTPGVRPAITYWKSLERFAVEGGFSYVEAYPKTGRTHQIRIHFRSIGHPLVCDRTYGANMGTCPCFGIARQALHSYALEIELPGEGVRRRFVAPEPADFAGAVLALRKAATT